jgi:glycosyltransferase involved in cell wall biosynthesis
MNDYKVSVIVPVYNADKYLRQCLDSIINQTFKNVEIICVNDGSTDSSLDILNEYAKKDERIIIVNQKNSGAGIARNNGLEIARGKYISFLDSDDFFEPTMYEQLYDKAETHQADIVLFGLNVYNMQTGKFTDASWCLDYRYIPSKDTFSYKDIPETIFQITSPGPCNKFYLKSFADKLEKFPPLGNSEDVPFVLSSIARAKKISTIKDNLYHYRRGYYGNVESLKDNNPLAFFDAFAMLKENLIKLNIYDDVKKSYINKFLNSFIYHINTMKTMKGFTAIYNFLHSKSFEKFDIDNYQRNDFYLISDYDRFFEIKNTPIEKYAIKVSLIIPIYNVEKYLHKCLDSAVNQTLKDIEIICINDGSTDNSLDILNEYAKQDNRVKIFNQKNQGQGASRNRGMEVSKSKYIMFIDADDWIELDTLEVFYINAVKNNADVVMGNFLCALEDSSLLNRLNHFQKYYDSLRKAEGLYKNDGNFRQYRSSPCCKLYKKEIIDRYGMKFPQGLIQEDEAWHWYYFSAIENICVLDKVFYNRLIRADSAMSLRDANYKGFFDMLSILEHIYDYLQKNKLYKKYERQYNQYFINFTADMLRRCGNNQDLCKETHQKVEKLSKKLKIYLPTEQTNVAKNIFKWIFSVYNERNHKVVRILGLKIKLRKEKIVRFKKATTKFLEKILSVKNENIYKIVRILGIKIKIKSRHREMLNKFARQEREMLSKFTQQEKEIKSLYQQISNNNEDLKKLFVEQGNIAEKNITQKIDNISERLVEQKVEFQKQKIALEQTTKKNHSVLMAKLNENFDSMVRITPKATLTSITVHLADHCNLKCAGCDHFSSIADKKFANIDLFERDIKRLSQLMQGSVGIVKLMGGEPLLNPEIISFMQIARKYLQNTRIEIVTNGILLKNQQENFWHAVKENDITLVITKYPLNTPYEQIEATAKSYGAKLEYYGNTRDVLKTSYHIPLDIEGKQDPVKNFLKCFHANNCVSLLDGKIYTCTVAPNIVHFNKYFNKNIELTENDYIDIYKARDMNEILQFIAKPTPFCKYCNINGRTFGHKWSISKKQIEEWT